MIQQSKNETPNSEASQPKIGATLAQIVLSALGIVDAGLLYLEDKKAVDLPCTSNGGCETVAASTYAQVHVLGHDIPLAVVGLAGYVLLLTLAMAKSASETISARRMLSITLLVVSAGATAYSWYLQYIAHYVIGAFCIYCRASAIIMTLIFLVSAYERIRAGLKENRPAGQAIHEK